MDRALARAARLDQAWEDLRDGKPSELDATSAKKAGAWTRPLVELVPDWIAHKRERHEATEHYLRQVARQVMRALEDLRVRTAQDLRDVVALDQRARALPIERKRLQKEWQGPLRLFVRWLAGNQRVLDHDPLATWEPIRHDPDAEPEAKPRAYSPEELARALRVLERLAGSHHERLSPLRTVFVVLLVAAPRIQALCEREALDFDPEARRIDFGKGRKKKRRGAGALDPATSAELAAYLDGRAQGPLVRGPGGRRLDRARALKVWLEAFGLGVAWQLWPEGAPLDWERLAIAERYLRKGVLRVGKGGNPKRIKKETLRARQELLASVRAVGEAIRARWESLMEGVSLHAFRDTHETWARVAGVNPLFVDKQLGHAPIGGSATGRTYYLDVQADVVDASASAEAVRATLDRALAELGELPPGLAAPAPAGPST
ncbi:MAG: hypothetical protein AB7N76_09660 [Planctomycetota bacterium]